MNSVLWVSIACLQSNILMVKDGKREVLRVEKRRSVVGGLMVGEKGND
jgi:hypothetical protein